MEKRRLGNTDIYTSVLGFGASPLGGVFGEVTQAEADDCVRRAIDLGINYFDTSPFYGLTKSESTLGKALRGIERSKFVVSTKVGRYGDKEFDFSAQRVKKSLNESLERLGLDHVELCICHDVEFGDVDQITSETIPALKELQREGKIKHIGISGLPLEVFKRCFERSKDIDFILSYCHYTMFDTTLQRFWDEKLHGSGIGIINASPLSMGLLTKEGPPSWHPASTNIRDVCRAVASHCDSQGVDIAEMAIKYSLEASFPSSTLVGMKTTKMVEANVSVFDKTFPSDLQEWTSKQFDAIRDESWPSGRDEYN